LFVRPGTYPRIEHFKSASLGEAPALPLNMRSGLKVGLPGTNTFVNYDYKKGSIHVPRT